MFLDFNGNGKFDKNDLQLLIAALLALLGIGLLIAGFLFPPAGVIDSSVLTAAGEVFTFCGALLGIDYHYAYLKDKISEDNKKDKIE